MGVRQLRCADGGLVAGQGGPVEAGVAVHPDVPLERFAVTLQDQTGQLRTWPEVAGGASVSATVRVRISEDLADGAVIDNLAVISAAGGEPSTNGIRIGMPPTALPTFQ